MSGSFEFGERRTVFQLAAAYFAPRKGAEIC